MGFKKAPSRGGGRGYGRGRGRGGGRGGRGGAPGSGYQSSSSYQTNDASQAESEQADAEASKLERMVNNAAADDRMDKRFGFDKYTSGPSQLGWMINFQPTVFRDPESNQCKSAVDYYFLKEDGSRFKVCLPYKPYFFLRVQNGTEAECEQYLRRKFERKLTLVEQVEKEDLDLKNHLIGLQQIYLKLSFLNVQDLMDVRSKINPIVNKNKVKVKTAYETFQDAQMDESSGMPSKTIQDVDDFFLDLREYDVPYHMRVSIDCKLNCAKWFDVTCSGQSEPAFKERPDILKQPDPVVFAWDIETTKLPLKFPNAEHDQIMMVSYMVDGQGYLINNREIISEDVEDFEYTPKPEYEGPFEVMNEPDEKALIQRFFEHIQELKPLIQVTYNGDFFDWPFLEARSVVHGLNMYREIGFRQNKGGEYQSRYSSHMDAYCWVKRDSYLPVGSQGLKAVTKAKLRYDPIEIHYEDICRMAAEQPQALCNYSVSDAVATYYLYMKYVHPFVFALCTIIPLGPDDVLRKGSGTLCEALLMTESFHCNIIMPNKNKQQHTKLHDGHVLESETYVGGHVEALESGVFRNDIPCRFRVVPEAIQGLIDGLDDALRHAIVEEEKFDYDAITNYDEERDKILKQLEDLRDQPYRREVPLIYHLDVAAMYPNIILTNRLQPMAMVDEATCAACEFNKPESRCQREMDWSWRGEMIPASKGEYEMVKSQLQSERFPSEWGDDNPPVAFHDLSEEKQSEYVKSRLKAYSQKVYKKSKQQKLESRTSTICQRENPFYIDTVRAFRDRRYVYKGKLKAAQKDLVGIIQKGDPEEIKNAKNLVVLFDSLQLAHKCILNSFYGYVMRKGARWYSLEMAGIVCLTGANIITKAREIVEQIGRPLELDTDGIWCILPGTFPENLEFKTTLPGKKSKLVVSYPGAMLNIMVKHHFTNDQYQTLVNPNTLEYQYSKENSIFFEVDGPYKAMILPASKEKDKRLKKRYAVYDLDGSLAELKGFEIKRNGELKIIKVFQAGVFDSFLLGETLEDIYGCVAKCADHWLDILYTRGAKLSDTELFDLISENRSMSRTLTEYGELKSSPITTAKRLAEFLGDEMVKDKGLACQFIIVRYPPGAPVTERAIPVAIFQAEEAVKKSFLRKWLKTGSGDKNFDIRDILDWEYYIERLSGTIQKIITIPAAMQNVTNPVPRVRHPDWLHSRLLEQNDKLKQKKINEMFKIKAKPDPSDQPSAMEVDDGRGDVEMSDADAEALGNKKQKQPVDIEDQFMSRSQQLKGHAKKGARVTQYSKKRGNEGEKQVEQSQEVAIGNWKQVLGPEPLYTTETYAEWLTYNKQKWEMQKNDRKRRRAMGVDHMSIRSKRTDLGNYFAKQATSISRNHWEIIQIVETNDPGVMRVWAMVNGDMHCMKINCYRRFYVNLRVPDQSDARRRVNRALPRARQCLNLYEFDITEREFMDNQTNLSSYFAHPDVEGVYETQVPLLWRSVVELGCVCAVGKKVGSRQEYTLNDFVSKTTAECDYLDNDSFQRVYLHHNSSGVRGMFGLFFPASAKGYIFVIDPGRNEDGVPSAKRIWKETYNVHYHESDEVEPHLQQPENITFESRVLKTARAAGRPIHQLLLKYSESRNGPTALVLQSPVSASVLAELIPSLNDFPIIANPANNEDDGYPALDWQRHALKQVLYQFSYAGQWLENALIRSRFSHVPVGNLPQDYQMFTCDVFFARALKAQNHLLWVSPSARPDLGGKEEDDNRMLTEVDGSDDFKINVPGVYSSVCVLELSGLAVNTILRSANINEMEGAAGSTISLDAAGHNNLDDMMGQGGSMSMLTSFDETAQCTPVFRVLKTLVHTWLREVVNNENIHADEQLLCLYRWLKSSEAKMYDPALYRMVQYMMKKVFMQLVAEFKRLGANVISATMDKIMICTGKTNCDDAKKYMDYILSCIKAKPLFSSLVIEPKHYWEHLVWMDTANFGGVKERTKRHKRKRNIRTSSSAMSASEDESMFEDEEEDGTSAMEDNTPMTPRMGTDDPDHDYPLHMEWNIAEFLPEILNQQFLIQIGNWIGKTWSKKLEDRKDRGGVGKTPVKNQPHRQVAEAKDENMEEMVGDLEDDVFRDLTEKLIDYVPKIQKTMPGDAASDHSEEFPVLPGSHLKLNNPALEFVKMVCATLTLDKSSARRVNQLKATLLKLIKVREFSKEAKFADPCLRFELSGVSCAQCSAPNDLDLCRDTRLAAHGNFTCAECDHKFPSEHIEHLLTEYIHRKSLAFQLQDLVCDKCNMVKAKNMSSYCSCSGNFILKFKSKDYMATVSTLTRIAKFHKFEILGEELDWIAERNSLLAH